jgi:hypothetical protein
MLISVDFERNRSPSIKPDTHPMENRMTHSISLPIPMTTFMALADYVRDYGDERDPSEIATLAIDAWLAVAKGEAAFAPAVRGYQWKDLFLPERTEVRMLCGATYTYANVVGDALMYAGQGITPSQFASLVGGARRNAWRDLWVRLPGSRQWKKAGYHRVEQNKKPAHAGERPFHLTSPETASAVMACSLKNALALIEKASALRHGVQSRRTDILPDD